MARKPYYAERYYGLALDPIHVGTGGYRLGRVDLSIVREPGTNIPKVPGTSLSGVARAYTAMAYTVANSSSENHNNNTVKYPGCAGKGGDQGQTHCGRHNCPVCVAFGFSKGDERQSFQGLAQFSDARIAFFPVHSMVGPVWATCPSVLTDLGVPGEYRLADERFRATSGVGDAQRLNLGWLMLDRDEDNEFTLTGEQLGHVHLAESLGQVLSRAVLIPDKLFETVVNSNLEVRTSVSINPKTGAAESGALFTYEAIPRGTVLWFTVTYADPGHFQVGGNQVVDLPTPSADALESVSDFSTQGNHMRAYVWDGLELVQHLGVGGMATRGMGRMRILQGGEHDKAA